MLEVSTLLSCPSVPSLSLVFCGANCARAVKARDLCAAERSGLHLQSCPLSFSTPIIFSEDELCLYGFGQLKARVVWGLVSLIYYVINFLKKQPTSSLCL